MIYKLIDFLTEYYYFKSILQTNYDIILDMVNYN